jgi:3-oxoacyl-[acyl-carrier protein] reductase
MKTKDIKAIITGSTSGIGLETARILKENGAQVIINGRNAKKVEEISSQLALPGFKADVSSPEEVVSLFEFAQAEMGGLNVLINNAGFGQYASLVDTTPESFQSQWEVNTKGLFLCGKEAAIAFMAQRKGTIINIGSTASLNGFPSGSAYVASKFAVSGLTQCWRAELRPYNIRVMQVNPSEVITEFGKKAGYENKDQEHKLKPSEIAHLILSMLTMSDIGFIPEASVWATNPWGK